MNIYPVIILFEYLPSYYTEETKNNNESINIFGDNNLSFRQISSYPSDSNKMNLNNINNNLTNIQNMNNLRNLSQQFLNQQLVNNINMQLLLQNNINNINNLSLQNSTQSNNSINSLNPLEFAKNLSMPMVFTNPLQINPQMNIPNIQNNISNLPNREQSLPIINPLLMQKNEEKELPFPEFYIYDEENKKVIKSEKEITKNNDNIEELLKEKKNLFSVLLKFVHKGIYNIKFIISYKLKRKDILDEYEVSQENILKFESIEPFNCTYEINSANFFSIMKENTGKENIKINKYLTNEKIYFNFILANKLRENIIIKNIEIELDKDKLTGKNENLEVNSNLLEVMALPEINQDMKNNILTILSNGEYCIPFDTEFYGEFKGKIGKIKIKWTTPSLNEYEQNLENNSENNIILINENKIDFPFIMVNNLELDYKYEINMNEKKEILLDITVENNTKKNKKIIFFIEKGNEINFMISGKIKQSKNIRGGENIHFKYILIPLKFGELKLPSLKIWEMSLNINSKDKKLCSHYYFPQKIKVI